MLTKLNRFTSISNNQELYESDFKLLANIDGNRNSHWVARSMSMCVATEHRVLSRVGNRLV